MKDSKPSKEGMFLPLLNFLPCHHQWVLMVKYILFARVCIASALTDVVHEIPASMPLSGELIFLTIIFESFPWSNVGYLTHHLSSFAPKPLVPQLTAHRVKLFAQTLFSRQ